MFNEENKLLGDSQSSLLKKTQSIRYLRVVDESEVIVRALYAFLQLLDKSQSSRNHRHVLEDRRVTWKTSKQLKTQDKIIANTPVMLRVDNEGEARTLGFLFLHLILEDHFATFQFLLKHFDQPGISSLSIGCYQGSFQQSAKHEQNLPSRDSMKLCCHFCIEKTNTNAFHQRHTFYCYGSLHYQLQKSDMLVMKTCSRVEYSARCEYNSEIKKPLKCVFFSCRVQTELC